MDTEKIDTKEQTKVKKINSSGTKTSCVYCRILRESEKEEKAGSWKRAESRGGLIETGRGVSVRAEGKRFVSESDGEELHLQREEKKDGREKKKK